MASVKDLDRELILKLYETMLKIRLFEETESRIYRSGEQEGFIHLYIGQEAIATGVCANLNKDDYITSTHRGHGHVIAKGGNLGRMMAELFLRKDGYCLGRSGSLHIADVSIGILGANGIVGDGNPIATGAGYSIKLRGTKQVAVSFFGDGASNQGTFHESVNMAAAWNLPVIYVIEKNLIGCGVESRDVYHPDVLKNLGSRRAMAYGLPGYDIDGNDVVEVYLTAKKAVERARKGEGPTLISCSTYRQRAHWEGDIDVRDKAEKEEWFKKDPIDRIEKRMSEENIITEDEIKAYRDRVQKMVDDAVEFARKSPPPEIEDALKYVYAE